MHLSDTKLLEVLLHGKASLNSMKNSMILNGLVIYILKSESFEEVPYNKNLWM